MKKLALPLAAPRAAFLCRRALAVTKQNLPGNRRRTFAALLAATIVAVGLLSLTPPARAQAYLWTNFAGKPGGPGNSDGTGAAATFGHPAQVAVDVNGNVYVADIENNAIRKVTPAGVVTTFAGSLTAPPGSADGTGSAARFDRPSGVAVDANGNLYVADTGNHTIRKITPAGVVTTLAGSAGGFGNADGTGAAAEFNYPYGVALDANGNLFVADSANNTIRKVTSAGVVTTLAGSPGNPGSTDGTGSAAQFYDPQGVVVDGSGNVYVADTSNSTIRKVTPAGVVTTLAGSAGSVGSADGTGSAARFSSPNQLVLGSDGCIYVADTHNDTIRRVTPAGVVTTLAGSAGNPGFADGSGSAARFSGPQGIAVDHNGNFYVGDTGDDAGDPGNSSIRKVTPAGMVTTLAGSVPNSGAADGTGTVARFNGPEGTVVDGNGNVYVADANNNTIRKIAPAGVVTTLAGSAGITGSADGAGGAARFNFPEGVAVDTNGNVYVADTNNHTIRKITPAGVVTTLAGSAGSPGSADGTGGAARFNSPTAVTADGNGNVYVADALNYTIRKVTPAGVVTTLAGSAGNFGFVDGTGPAAQFSEPFGIAVDKNGYVFVADTLNDTIRRVSPVGVVITLAGSLENYGFADGTGNAAQFDYPYGVAVDGNGNVYVADSSNHAVRKVTPAGVVTTIGGSPDLYGAADGVGTAAVFSSPVGITVSASGLLFVADYNEDRVVRGTAQFDHDFNGDGYPDYVLFNTSTLQTALWYMNGPTHTSSAYGPTLPLGWTVAGVADFNGDGDPDYLLFNAGTKQTALWYLNGPVHASSVYGPTLPAGWSIVGVADFNGDGKPDFVLFNASTLQTAIWYMNGPTHLSSVYGPTLPAGWTIAAVADINGDGKPDFVLFNASTLQTAIWYMNGPTHVSSVYGPTLPAGWTVAGVADFNGDGKPDFVVIDASTLQTGIWYLNGPTHVSSVYGPTLPAGWRLVAP